MVPPLLKQSWVVTGVMINTISIGLVTAYPYSLLPGLISSNSDVKADLETASWLASVSGLGSIIGFFTSSFFTEKFGRKLTHLITMPVTIIGWLLIYFATNVPMILCGRILCGYSIGCTVTLGAVVIGEYTSPEYRGIFLNLKTVVTFIGTMSLHIVSQYYDWRRVALFCKIPLIFAFINILTWPESPSWLASKHRFDECKTNFLWLRGSSEASIRELDALIQQQTEVVNKTNLNFYQQMFKIFGKFTQKNFLMPLSIIWIGFNLLEASGRHYLPSYAMDIIQRLTNVTDKSKSFYYVLGMDFFTLLGCSVSTGLIKFMKRRTLLFLSGVPCVLILLTIIVYLYLADFGIITNDKPWIPISLFVLYLLFVNLGCSPIPLSLTGELFPLEHKSVGIAFSGMSMSSSLVVTIKTAPSLLAALDVQGAFLVYASVMTVCLLYLYYALPETKDRTLLEIEDFFKYGRFLDSKNIDYASERMLKK